MKKKKPLLLPKPFDSSTPLKPEEINIFYDDEKKIICKLL